MLAHPIPPPAVQMTPNPACVPIKRIGIAGHPLPLGEAKANPPPFFQAWENEPHQNRQKLSGTGC
jgi:hypothetical protein